MKLNTIVLIFLESTWAGSWIDCISGEEVDFKGEVVYYGPKFYKNCIGFPRGYPGRENTEIGNLYNILHQDRNSGLNPPETTPMCGKLTQTPGNYSEEFPMTKVSAGTPLKIWHTMNGYRNPQVKLELYGYNTPNRVINTVKEFNNAVKLAEHAFSSKENCLDINHNNSLCWFDFKVPENWESGIYSLIWVFPWNSNGIEEYVTCFEIDVSNKKVGQSPSLPPSKSVKKYTCKKRPAILSLPSSTV